MVLVIQYFTLNDWYHVGKINQHKKKEVEELLNQPPLVATEYSNTRTAVKRERA